MLETQYNEANAKIRTAQDLLRLVLVHVGADLGLRQTVALVGASGGPQVSHVTLHKKMRLAVGFLSELVRQLCASNEASPERWAGYELVLVDGSSFAGPGADGTDAQIHLQLRLADLAILGAEVGDRTTGETLKRFSWKEGQLAVCDRGYANPPGVAHVVGQGGDVLVRVNRSALPLFDKSSVRVDLRGWLRSLRGHQAKERWVAIYDRETEQCIEGRLIACRLPAAEAEKARARTRRELGAKTTEQDLEAAQYVVLFTTVPAARLSAAECLGLYRLRWQVELAFKRWKSLCHFDRLPNYRDDTIMSWLYGKLLLALLLQRMASGATSLFPPEEADATPLVLRAVEGAQHPLARHRRRAAAA